MCKWSIYTSDTITSKLCNGKWNWNVERSIQLIARILTMDRILKSQRRRHFSDWMILTYFDARGHMVRQMKLRTSAKQQTCLEILQQLSLGWMSSTCGYRCKSWSESKNNDTYLLCHEWLYLFALLLGIQCNQLQTNL